MFAASKATFMNLKIICTFGLLLFSNITKADVGDPTIQAVCRLTLNNGKMLEGLITLGYGSYDGVWMNGFYLESYLNNIYKYQNTEFLSLDFKSFIKIDSSYDFSGLNNYRNCRKLKFLQWANGPSYEADARRLIYNDSIPNDTLKIISIIERKYLVMDSINIYYKIPSDTYLETFSDTAKEKRFNTIAIKDISKFELLEHPSTKWLDLIEKAKQKFEKINSTEDSTGDFIQAVWYHELSFNKEEFEHLQKVIMRNIER